MKKLSTWLLIAAVATCFSSCTTRYYAPGLYQNDVQYMFKPHSQDSVKSRVYVSGALLTQSGAGGEGSSTSGLLNIYQAHTLKNVNLAYGVIGYTGAYSRNNQSFSGDSNLPDLEDHVYKSFTGYGFNGSASVYFNNKNVDFRVLGVDLTYTHESGDYLAYRKAIYDIPGVLSSPRANMFTYGIFSEYVFHPRPTIDFGFKVFFNKTTGAVNRDLQDYGGGFNSFGGTVFSHFDHLNVSGTFGFNGNNGAGLGAALQLGVGYNF